MQVQRTSIQFMKLTKKEVQGVEIMSHNVKT